MKPEVPEPSKTVARLRAEIKRQEDAIKKLKARGKLAADAERHLQELRNALAFLGDQP
jgi:hypothetical protein